MHNLGHVTRHSCGRDAQPVIFLNGERVDFPPPTKTIRAPRIRHPKQRRPQDRRGVLREREDAFR